MLSRRLQTLAQPKLTYDEYNGNNTPLPNVNANQMPIWPISQAAMTYVPTRRTLALARPQRRHSARDFLNVDENGDPTPVRVITEATKQAVCSQRLLDLAKPTRYTSKYEHGSEELMIERIPKRVLRAVPSPRIIELATPKQLPQEYYAINSPKKQRISSAPSRIPSRILQLATPSERNRRDTQEKFEVELRQRLLNATKYHTKARDRKLAKPILYVNDYKPNKTLSETMIISPAAKTYKITERILDLSQPRVRRLDIWEQEFNPSAFTVSPAALAAKGTERLSQLSKPISR